MVHPTGTAPRITRRRAALRLAIVSMALAASWADAYRSRWWCDDAFVSFRYADHAFRGLGLVFNEGERVEGYTNLLWTLLIWAGLELNLDPMPVTAGLGLAAYAGTLAVCLFASRSLARDFQQPALLGTAALGFAAMSHARIFATSGLETSLFTLLVTTTCVLAITARSCLGLAGLGLAGSLAVLCRPEGVVVFGLAWGCLAGFTWASRTPLRGPRLRDLLVCSALPVAITFAAQIAFRWLYYGALVPNTYYAKAGHGSAFAQGLVYLAIYFEAYLPLTLGAVFLGLALVRAWRSPERASPASWRGPLGPALLLIVCGFYTFYVARVGGDFMFARFALPYTPLLLLGLELGLVSLAPPRFQFPASIGCALGLLMAPVPTEQLNRMGAEKGISGIVEERRYYPAWRLAQAKDQGDYLRTRYEVDTHDVRIAIQGSQAMLAYYGRFPVVIESSTGLTDAYIARLPPREGARVGHLREAPLSYLRERGVDFKFEFATAQPLEGFNTIDFGEGIRGRIITYRRAVLEHLRSRGARFTSAEDLIDGYVRSMGARSPADVAATYAMFRGYYFDHNPDPDRERPFVARLGLVPPAAGSPPLAPPVPW